MNSTATPVVSIVIATRNRPTCLAHALKSIAAQSYKNIEVIIVDDGSDVGTVQSYEQLL